MRSRKNRSEAVCRDAELPLPGHRDGSVPRALLFSLFIFASTGQARAASLQGQIPFGSTIPNSLSGDVATTSINIPRFNPATGQLNAVIFSFSGNFSCYASNVAQGGVYIPPSYIKSWTWACDYIGTLYGTGFSFATTSYQSDYERSGTGDTYVKSPSVSRTGIPFSKANNRVAYSASPTSPFVQFVGASGSATIYFASQLSTAIPPLSATLGGFSWTPSSAVTVTGAQIEGSSTQQVTIVYDYTPFPILALPASNTLQTNPFDLQFSLPEAASSGSLKLTFTSGGTDKVLTIPDQFGTADFHALTFDPTSAIPDGTYTKSTNN